MNLEFGVLWIEDSFSDAEEAQLVKAAANSGFDARIETSSDGSNLNDLAQRQRSFHCFDLILVDLNLANGVRGDELALEVRERFKSTPMLFYSGSESVSDLRTRMATNRVEGVFCAERRDFLVRAEELIAEVSESVNRLSGMRGLAARVVAECDDILKAIILAARDRGDEAEINAALDRSVADSTSEIKEKYAQIETLEERLRHRAVDSMQLYRQVRRCTTGAFVAHINGDARDKLRSLRTDTRDFAKDVLKKRNLLSHAIEIETTDGWVLESSAGVKEIAAGDFPELRRNFLRYLHSFRELHALIAEHGVE